MSIPKNNSVAVFCNSIDFSVLRKLLSYYYITFKLKLQQRKIVNFKLIMCHALASIIHLFFNTDFLNKYCYIRPDVLYCNQKFYNKLR